jgi:DNA invertase Pin-like site-specific DNA recombinase
MSDETLTHEKTAYAVLYAAKSTEDRHASIPDQFADALMLAEREGLTVNPGNKFSDEAISAYHANRGAGLAAAMARCEQIAVEHGTASLIVQHSDRLARGDGKTAKHLVEYALWALKHDVTIRSFQDPQTFGDLLYTVVTGQRNHEDSKRKALAVKDGMRRRGRDRGMLPGGKRPFGYRWVAWLESGERRSRLEIVTAEAELVRRIFEWSIGGVSQQRIAQRLNAEQVRPVRGGRWAHSSVNYMLCNLLYVGMVRVGDEFVAGAHDPILDQATWDAAAARRTVKVHSPQRKDRRGAPPGSNNGGGRKPVGSHLFTRGLLRCGHCGAPLSGRREPRADGSYSEVYRCLGRSKQGKHTCPQGALDRATIDDAMLSELSERYLDIEKTRERVRATRASDAALAAETLAQAEAEALRARSRLAKVTRGWQDEIIDDDEYAAQRAELAAEIEAAEAAANQARTQAATVEAADDDPTEDTLRRIADLRAAVIGGLQNADGLDGLRALLHDLFECVIYFETSDGAPFLFPGLRAAYEDVAIGSYQIHLEWTNPELLRQSG